MSNKKLNLVPHIRVFISSPGDVNDERKIALDVIAQFPYKPSFRERVAFRVVAWDKPGAGTPMRATLTPQDAINQGLPMPAECDIVVSILWGRMGTPFSYEGKDFLSGTHWELLNALESERPETLIYRRMDEPEIKLRDPDRIKKIEQYEQVESFFQSNLFWTDDGKIKRGINSYEYPEGFRRELENHLETLVLEFLKRIENTTEAHNDVEDLLENTANITVIEPKQWDKTRSPFPGLRPFTEDDTDIFFGRGAETDALVAQLTRHRFVAVVASSGSGKSSLVSAGLIPRLRASAIEGSQDWKIARFTPGNDPFERLYQALLVAFPDLKLLRTEAVKQTYLKTMRDDPNVLIEVCTLGIESAPEWAEVLLFIDQFEELFTLTNPADIESFLNALDTIAKGDRMRVVVTMRSDFYHRAVEYSQLADLLRQGSFPLAIPKRDALKEMIVRPAERAGIEFEVGLIERMLDDVGHEPGNLALLAYALDELNKMDDDGILTSDEYNQLNGVQGAIGTRAEAVWGKLELEETILHQLFLHLIEVDERGTATRQRTMVRHDDSVQIHNLIEAFVQARLLIKDRDLKTNAETIEVAHEAILREWKRLVDWIEKRQADFRVIARMRRDAEWWERNGRREQDLPRAEQYDAFEWACDNLNYVPDLVRDQLLLEYAVDERERLIQSLASDHIDESQYNYTMYRLKQLGADISSAYHALFSNYRVNSELLSQILYELDSFDEIQQVCRVIQKMYATDWAVVPLISMLGHHDSNVVQVVAVTLGKLGDERAFDPLLNKITNPYRSVRMAVTGALGALEDTRAILPIIHRLADDDKDVRNTASKTLIQFDEPAVEPLLETLSKPSVIVIQTLGELRDKRAVVPLIKLLDFKNSEIRVNTALALGTLEDKRAVVPLINALQDPYWQVRSSVAVALGQLGDIRAVEPIIDSLYTIDAESFLLYVKKSSIIALGKLRDKRATEHLIKLLGDYDYDWDIRYESAKALGKIGDLNAFEPLVKQLTHYDARVRRSVAKALGRLGDKRAVDPLVAKIDDEDLNVRKAVARALGKLEDNRATDVLVNQLSLNDTEMILIVLDALGQINDKRIAKSLLPLLNHPNSFVRIDTIKILKKLEDVSAIDDLITKLDDESIDVRRVAVNALGWLDSEHDKQAVEPLIQHLKNSDWRVRMAVADALGRLNDPRAVKPLISLLIDSESFVRLTVIDALGNLGDERAIQPLQAMLDSGNYMLEESNIKMALDNIMLQSSDT